MAIKSRTDPYILEGRVVTMAAAGVIDRGRIFIQGERIMAVGAVGDPRPAGFAGAPVTVTVPGFSNGARL